jgi:hypothetical protein
MKGLKKKVAVVGVAVGAVIGGNMAYAAWTANGSGSGNAQALSAQSVTVTARTGTADLYPGVTAGDVFFTLNNTNPYSVTFTSMTSGTVSSGASGACASTNVTAIGATGLSITVPGNSTLDASIPDVVTMVAGAPDGCQGVTFTIPLTLAGTQS